MEKEFISYKEAAELYGTIKGNKVKSLATWRAFLALYGNDFFGEIKDGLYMVGRAIPAKINRYKVSKAVYFRRSMVIEAANYQKQAA